MRHFVSKKQIRSLYFAFIQPYVDYGLINWGSAPDHLLSMIKRKLEKAVRIMHFKKKNEICTNLFKECNILDFDRYYKYSMSNFMWKFSNGITPAGINFLFKVKIQVYETGLGNTLNYVIPNVRLEMTKRGMGYRGALIWRGVPNHIKLSKSINSFKQLYKKHLLSELQ